MNVNVMKWLLLNRAALQQVLEAVKGWKKDMPYADQWEIVDKVARILLPILDPATVNKLCGVSALMSIDDAEVTAMSVGAEVQALGFDWRLIVEVVIPIVISILQAIANTP